MLERNNILTQHTIGHQRWGELVDDVSQEKMDGGMGRLRRRVLLQVVSMDVDESFLRSQCSKSWMLGQCSKIIGRICKSNTGAYTEV